MFKEQIYATKLMETSWILHRVLRNISQACASLRVGDSLTETSVLTLYAAFMPAAPDLPLHSLSCSLTHRNVCRIFRGSTIEQKALLETSIDMQLSFKPVNQANWLCVNMYCEVRRHTKSYH